MRLIQGDGIDFTTLEPILAAVQAHGWSADNLAFGSGGGLLQKLNRDTLKFAFKCSAVVVAGRERDVWKQPVSDHGKRSKPGRLKLIASQHPEDGGFATVRANAPGEDLLQVVFEDGRVTRRTDLAAVRRRAAFG